MMKNIEITKIDGHRQSRTKNMRIGIDIDDILCNTAETLLKFYNQDSGDNLKLSDLTNRNIYNFVQPKYKSKVYECSCGNRVWQQIQCIKDSQKYIQKLYDDGYELYIVTSTHGAVLFNKWKWINRNYPCIKADKIIRCVHKQLLELDYLIDDFQDNFIGGKCKGLILDYPWNVDFKQDNVKRVYNWKEIYHELIST